MITGHFVVVDLETAEEIDRVACQYPVESSMWEKVERGLLMKVNTDRYFVGWEDA